jgi:hypothetical protein
MTLSRGKTYTFLRRREKKDRDYILKIFLNSILKTFQI